MADEAPALPVPNRFRAYAESEGVKHKFQTNKVTGERRKVQEQPWPIDDVAFEGALKSGTATFDAGDTVITRVVFIGGEEGEEVTFGELPIGASGKISAAYVEPATNEDNWADA